MILALVLSGLAFAGIPEKVDKLIAKGQPDLAVIIGNNWLARNKDSAKPEDLEEVQMAVQRAYFAVAERKNTVTDWAVFRETYRVGPLVDEAGKREAALAWQDIKSTSSRYTVQMYRDTYPEGPHEKEAKALEADLAYSDAVRQDDLKVWKAFVKDFPGDTRARDALRNMEGAALREAEADGSTKAYQEFLSVFRDSERRKDVIAELMKRETKLDVPCKGSTPSCSALKAGDVIRASWTPLPETPVNVSLVGTLRGKAVPLAQVFDKLAGPHKAEVPTVVDRLMGDVHLDSGSFELVLPFSLKRASGIDGYAVQISPSGAEPTLLPFRVSQSWETPTEAPKGTFTAKGLELFFQKDGDPPPAEGAPPPKPFATSPIKLDQDDKVLRNSRWFFAWDDTGIVRIDLVTGAVLQVADKPADKAWFAGGTFLAEQRTGEQNSLLAVYPDGRTDVVLPRPNTPDSFEVVSIARDAPAVLVRTDKHFWIVPADGPPNPVEVRIAAMTTVLDPATVKASLDRTGQRVALFMSGIRPQVAIVPLRGGKSQEAQLISIDTRGLFGLDLASFEKAGWQDDGTVLALTTDTKKPLGVSRVKVPSGIVTKAAFELLEETAIDYGTVQAIDNAPDVLQFRYERDLASWLY